MFVYGRPRASSGYRRLRQRGVDVLTAQDDGCCALNDASLLDRATILNRVLFSQDRDFLGEASRRQKVGERFSGVVYAPQQKVSIGQCINDLELIAKDTGLSDWSDRLDYLPLR